jgi:hypothetical protein
MNIIDDKGFHLVSYSTVKSLFEMNQWFLRRKLLEGLGVNKP